MNTPSQGKLEFYVINNLRFQQMDEPFEIERRLTLPQAIALYNGHRPDQVSAIGVSLNNHMDVDIVQRRSGINTLVSDYQKMDKWKYNPELCVSAVNMLIVTLGIRQQMDNGAHIQPLQDRMHVMQLKGGDETRYLRWEGLEEVEHMGLKVDMRNYDLVYSDMARADETPNQLYQRLNTQPHPQGYVGHSLSVSDVLVYQGRKGCAAYYVDKLGFTLLPRFVRPPGEAEKDQPGKPRHVKEAR